MPTAPPRPVLRLLGKPYVVWLLLALPAAYIIADGMLPAGRPHYLRDTAAAFHAFYNALPILTAEEEQRHARLGLCKATQRVLANGLALLGVSAPETM